MTTDQLRELFSTRELIDLQRSDQDFEHSLKLMLRDRETGELGILEVSPETLILPDEIALVYKYEVVKA